MLAAPPTALLMLALLTGGAQATEPARLPDCDVGQERIDLPAEPDGSMYEVCISPGLSTMFVFYEADLLPTGMTLEGSGRFTVVEAGRRSLSLLPSSQILPGERLKLTVSFMGGEAPPSATFFLVVHPVRASRQVEVFRHRRTLASYQQAEKEQRAQLQECRADNERLRAEHGGLRGLTGLLVSRAMNEKGVAGQTVSRVVIKTQPARVINLARVESYRARGLAAVAVALRSDEWPESWVAAGAELMGAGRRALRTVSVWQAPVTEEDAALRYVVIEAAASEEELKGSFTLKLWDAAGALTITLTGVTFPPT